MITETREFTRSMTTLSIVRIFIVFALCIYFSLHIEAQMNAHVWSWDFSQTAKISIIYLLGAIAIAFFGFYQNTESVDLHRRSNITSTAFDLLMMALLYLSNDTPNALAILFFLPLLNATMLLTLPIALFFAAITSLIVLFSSSMGALITETTSYPDLFTAGLYGSAFFASVFFINRLIDRLIKQQQLAKERGLALQQQMAINQFIIRDMQDGVLVIDSQQNVINANPAALKLLGIKSGDEKSLQNLFKQDRLRIFHEAFWQSKKADNTFPYTTQIELPSQNRLELRFIHLSDDAFKESYTMIFLEDFAQINQKAQQLKLASMGRLTASIAHEVRNPLAAITYAATLLHENLIEANPVSSRLLTIIDDNAKRLNRMIEDILHLARRAQPSSRPLSLKDTVQTTVDEFLQIQQLAKEIVTIDIANTFYVRFDPIHLQEILINLLNNAIRYASGGQNSIRFYAQQNTEQAIELGIANDGPTIKPEELNHLFEPFYTTSSEGTGLGLYLARELALNNQANLHYETTLNESGQIQSAFVLRFSQLSYNA